VEDPRLIQGQGQYVDDFKLPGTLEVAFVRSPHAHARITSIDLSAARAVPGVVAVWDGSNVAHVPRIPNRVQIQEKHVSPLPALAQGYVTHVGYPVAMVVANDRYSARDAAERIVVDYEPLPANVEPGRALDADAVILHPSLGTNMAYRVSNGDEDIEQALAACKRRISLTYRHPRLAQIPMEPRGILIHFDRDADMLTVWRSSQSPFNNRAIFSAVFNRPEDRIRVTAPDVGGAFGSKGCVYPDETAVVAAAIELGVPIRWTSTRMEDFQFTLQGRDQTQTIDVGFDEDGIIGALWIRVLHNVGGVLLHPQAAPPLRVINYAVGAYRTPKFRADAIGVYTNTGPVGPYRGAGRPEAAFASERAIEEVARYLGMDRAEIRRRNFIQPDQFPYKTPAGSVYDSGDYDRAFTRALEIADYPGLREQQAAARARGELMGIGISTTIEVSGQGTEYGSVEIEPDGTVIAKTGSSSHGQGHETTFAQVVADQLGVPFEKVRIVKSDTALMDHGGGTGGSRSLVVGGSAMAKASDGVREKAVQVASAMLEVSAADLEYVSGGVQVKGAPERRLELGQIAAAAQQGIGVPADDRGLKDDTDFQPGGDAIPFAATVAVVRIDRDTGNVKLERLVAVDDIGTVVNPLVVDGQVAGGLAQGIAEALYERIAWDEDGQLITSTLLDYAVPTAHMLPDFELDLVETKSPNNPLGAKGVGESGCVSAPPAIVHAVLDALAPLGVKEIAMPMTSERVWRAIAEVTG
jgi:carbon-monoxide dehydrogenase large subunit